MKGTAVNLWWFEQPWDCGNQQQEMWIMAQAAAQGRLREKGLMTVETCSPSTPSLKCQTAEPVINQECEIHWQIDWV